MNIYILTLVAYSVLMITLGVYVSRRVRHSNDFFVAGRKLNGGLLFATMLAANIGAGSTVGATGLGYGQGYSAWWWVGSAGIGSLILAFTVGPKIWKVARDNNLYTVGDYLEHRYNKTVRIIGAVFLWIGGLTILSGQIIAVAWILNVIAGTGKPAGCLLAAIAVTAYFAVGGLHSAARVNILQLTIKIAGFVLTFVFLFISFGNLEAIRATASLRLLPETANTYFNIFGSNTATVPGFLITLVPAFIVSPGLLQKVFGAKDRRSVQNGVAGNAICLLLFAAVPVIFGIVARGYLPGLERNELALPTLLIKLLPTWMGALLLAAIFSAELSAADAVLFMLTTSLGKDLYKGVVKPNATDRQLMMITRLSTIGCGCIAVLFAIGLESVIQALSIFYSLITAVFFLPIIGGLYWSRIRASAATMSIAVTVSALCVFDLLPKLMPWWSAVSAIGKLQGFLMLPSLLIAIIAGGVAMVVVSLLGPAR
jgi:SSS family solute:Na+ symporter